MLYFWVNTTSTLERLENIFVTFKFYSRQENWLF